MIKDADQVTVTNDNGASKDPATSVTAISAEYENGKITVTLTGAGVADKNTVTVSMVNGGNLVKIATGEIEGASGEIAATLLPNTLYQVSCGELTYALGVVAAGE